MTAAAVYLDALRRALRSAPEPARSDIAAEVDSHLTDIAERDGGAGVTAAIERFGPAERYADLALEAYGLDRALSAAAPWRTAGAALRYAGRSTVVFAGAVLALGLLALALGFAAVAVVDLAAPDLAGLFVGEGGAVFGVVPGQAEAGARELLGRWIVPIALIAGAGCAAGAFFVLRHAVRRRLKALRRTT